MPRSIRTKPPTLCSKTTPRAPRTEQHQKTMMSEVAKLTAGSNGALDPADYDRTVATLLAGGSDP